MFKFLKYLFLIRLYKKAKKSFFILFISIMLVLLVSFVSKDLISVAENVYVVIVLKWIMILILWGFIVHSIYKIINISSHLFGTNYKQETKKTYILEKEKLLSKSERIIQKYTKE